MPLVGLEPYFYPSPRDVWQAFLVLMEKGILSRDEFEAKKAELLKKLT